MKRNVNKHDLKDIAYISHDSISDLYVIWYKSTKSPVTVKLNDMSQVARTYINNAHKYSYGVSTYYRLEG